MTPKAILIVEDSKIVQRIYGRALAPLVEAGTRLIPAFTGWEALAKVKSHPEIDLILLDTTLPDMDGCELLNRIKKDGPLKEVRVLIISTEDDETHVRKGYEAGATAFMPKPFRVEELIGWIRKTNGTAAASAGPRPLGFHVSG